ncbi:MAG: hypothetical protein A2281_14650 [Bacteroidetes bacterium RIFOXYA12_FULL_38_20]|nr:MAG: hypothetical protein A2281_14650 [Bacteroidetes bacterium RIFOXYA12_FULL_38_20]
MIVARSQTTVTLYPNIDANIKSGYSTTNYGTETNLDAGYDGRGPLYIRYLIQFNLSSIPEYAIITDAKLTLYGWSHLTTYDNSTYVKRITTAWDESTVTWTNKPTTLSTNYDTLANATSATQNFEIDFTSMVNDWVNYVYENNGVMFQWYLDGSSTTSTRKRFYSSDYTTDPTKVPKLEITYIVPTITTIYPSVDATIISNNPSYNNGGSRSFIAKRYVGSPSNYVQRSLMQFDVTTNNVPQSSIITGAAIRLKNNTHILPNQTYLKRITGSWTEYGVNYTNQPSSTTTGQITFGPSTSTTQDHTIGIRDWVNGWWDGTYTNYGFIMQLTNELSVAATHFHSSDATTESYRPYVKIAYVPPITLSLSNKSICNGESVVIGGSPTATGGTAVYTYSWSPSSGLSSTTVANPTASPTTTTTYTLSVIDYTGLVSKTDSLIVYVSSSTQVYSGSSSFTFKAEGGTYYDDGGSASNYGNSKSYTHTFYPCGDYDRLSFNFTSFGLESSANCVNDYLKVYDGPNTSAPLIGTYCGQTGPGIVNSTHSSGALTFQFVSNASTVSSGWAATITGKIDLRIDPDIDHITLENLGNIVLNASGGTSPYTYFWEDSSAYGYLQDLLPGQYLVTITDDVDSLIAEDIDVLTSVYWTNLSGLTVSNDTIYKSASNTNWTAVGITKNNFLRDEGYIKYIADDDYSSAKVFGLSDTFNITDYQDIKYGVMLKDTSFFIVNLSTALDSVAKYNENDEFFVERINDTIVVYWNDSLVQQWITPDTSQLWGSVAIKNQNDYFHDIQTTFTNYPILGLNTIDFGSGYDYLLYNGGTTADSATGDIDTYWVNFVEKGDTLAIDLDIVFSVNDTLHLAIVLNDRYEISDMYYYDVLHNLNSYNSDFYELNGGMLTLFKDKTENTDPDYSTLYPNIEYGMLVTPNNDQSYDSFVITGASAVTTYILNIYDIEDTLLYTTTSPTAYWNCKVNNVLVPVGTYRYYITADGQIFEGQFLIEY